MLVNSELSTFDDSSGELTIGFDPIFSCRLRFSSWSHGLSVQRFDGAGLERVRGDPEIPFFRPVRKVENNNIDVIHFLEQIPPRFLEAVDPFCCHQYTVLRMLLANPRSLDLLTSVPALYWLVADTLLRVRPDLQFTGRLLDRRQEEILLRIDRRFQDGKELLRFLTKVHLDRFDFKELQILKFAAVHPDIHGYLRHFQEIHISFLEMFFMYPKFLEFPVWKGMTSKNNDPQETQKTVIRDLRASLELGQTLKIPGFFDKIATIQTPDRLRQLLKQWSELRQLRIEVLRQAAYLGAGNSEKVIFNVCNSLHGLRALNNFWGRQMVLQQKAISLCKILGFHNCFDMVRKREYQALRELHDRWHHRILAERPWILTHSSLWRDTLQLGFQLRLKNVFETAGKCRDHLALQTLHRQWTKRFNEVKSG